MLTRSEAREHKTRVPRANWLARLAQRWRNMIATRRALRLLSAADDNMLKDIGVSRGEIERLVRHGRAPLKSGLGD